MHNKNYVPRKAKTTNNSGRREYISNCDAFEHEHTNKGPSTLICWAYSQTVVQK